MQAFLTGQMIISSVYLSVYPVVRLCLFCVCVIVAVGKEIGRKMHNKCQDVCHYKSSSCITISEGIIIAEWDGADYHMAKLVLTTDCGALEMSTARPRPGWIRVVLDWWGQGLHG